MDRYSSLTARSYAAAGISLACALLLWGCGAVEVPLGLGSNETEENTLVTGSVAESGVTDVDPADWQTVQNAISMSFSTLEDGSTTQWSNEATGSNGSIVPSGPGATEEGTFCRTFSTTLDSISGVERFDGKACRQANGTWKITKISPSGPAPGT